ncbi:hypothetical protein EBB07_32805 [Paenibacillaceae bacterium]|nr:hypothetical protein EBB07_32805 [Paenibacillaceae bacterium]
MYRWAVLSILTLAMLSCDRSENAIPSAGLPAMPVSVMEEVYPESVTRDVYPLSDTPPTRYSDNLSGSTPGHSDGGLRDE